MIAKCKIKFRRRRPNGQMLWSIYRPNGKKFNGSYSNIPAAVRAARFWFRAVHKGA